MKLENPFAFYSELLTTDRSNDEIEFKCEWPKYDNCRKMLLQCEDLQFELSFTNKTDDTSLNVSLILTASHYHYI
jgi:hypothetical protein